MAKAILKGHEARMKVQRGIDIACDAVRPTLGPIGMTAFIEFPGLDPIECDDGVTILKNIELPDHYENMGVQSLRKAALRTSEIGGDGTATTTVLTQALTHEAMKEVALDSSKIGEVRTRLEVGLAEILKALTAMKREVKPEDIEKIAAISSLDADMAKTIAEIIKEVGVDGVVTVERGPGLESTKEVVKGMRFERGLISPFFINAPNGQSILENAYVILVDRKISTNEQIIPILQSIGTGNQILLIADDVDSVALGSLAQNAINGVAKFVVVKNPYSGNAARDFLFDVAAITGATVISEEKGMKLSEATKALCGRIGKVISNKDKTTLIRFEDTETPELAARIAGLKDQIEKTTSPYEKGNLEDRLAGLTGGIGVIRVGAYTDTEFNAKKYKFENAVNATQAALQEGIVIGGGAALAKIARLTDDVIFRRALIAPLGQMAENAGMDRHAAVLKVTADQPHSEDFSNLGFNFKTGEYGDLFKTGVVDPFKVVRLALESAVAITRSVVGMQTAIVTLDEPEKSR